jgi:DNA end-binding protein Ku
VWRPASVEGPEEYEPPAVGERQVAGISTAPAIHGSAVDEDDQGGPATRIMLRPHDPRTGEEVEKSEVVKGYEYSRGQFVTFTVEELKALDVESSKIIDLEEFVPRGDIDPVYFDTPYYLYPDGPLAMETVRVIGLAMAEAGVAGIGRLTLSRRERMVIIEPRGAGMALFTSRAADEVRTPQFARSESDLDPEMVALAGAIIRQRIGKFDPSAFRDRYQDALRQLIEAKIKGVPIKTQAVPSPPALIDLMAALKRSLARELPAAKRAATKAKPTKATPDRRQAGLLLPLAGGRKRRVEAAAKSSTSAPKSRRKA